jgi:hypothetical protein
VVSWLLRLTAKMTIAQCSSNPYTVNLDDLSSDSVLWFATWIPRALKESSAAEMH